MPCLERMVCSLTVYAVVAAFAVAAVIVNVLF